MEVYRTETLLSRCVDQIVDDFDGHISQEDLLYLPPAIKDRLLHVLTKRGLVSDHNLYQLLHDKVRVLDLSECDVSDEGLRTIATTCRGLRKVDLNSAKASRTEITSEGVVTLAQHCRYLQVVYLRRCLNISDDAIIALSQHCPLLRELNIGGCPHVTDASLAALGENCPQLKSINFARANVTDDGVFKLVEGVPAKSLKEIHLDGCRALTDDAVEAILHFCPSISILLFHGCPNITERSRIALEEVMGGQMKMKQITWTIY